jgi:DNA modification methylase
MIELHRVLVHGGHAFTFAAWRPALVLGPALESSGMRLQNWAVWDKGNAGQGEHLRTQHETILHYCKGVGRHGEDAGKFGNVLAFPRVHHTAKVHPTEKPIPLLERLIRVGSLPGEIVLDPFAGTGPTYVAARRCGRICYGAELDPVYASFTRSRINDEALPTIDGQTGLDFKPTTEDDDAACNPAIP